jgi:GNAT superfamily N-acetyltransferase
VKVGLWGPATEDEAVAVLSAVRDAVGERAAVIAAAYADAERAPGLPPESLVAAAQCAGVAGCLLDTAVKDGRGLFRWLDSRTLAALVAEAHAAGLEVALAGALRAEDLPAVRATGADIVGVRSAACRDGRRTAPLDPARITHLRTLCATPHADPHGTTIRDAIANEKADLEALQLRASLVWEEYREPLLAEPEVIVVPAGAISAGRVRVAVAGDGPAGFSVVTPVIDGACELDGLFVEPELMGRGIGRELVADVVARSDGARRLDVIANPRAIGFYEKLGFQPGDTVQTRFGAALRMHLDLTS